jgi:hypothetical protein
VVVGGPEEKHEEGPYCIRNKKSWIEAGTDQTEYTAVQPVAVTKGTPGGLTVSRQIGIISGNVLMELGSIESAIKDGL